MTDVLPAAAAAVPPAAAVASPQSDTDAGVGQERLRRATAAVLMSDDEEAPPTKTTVTKSKIVFSDDDDDDDDEEDEDEKREQMAASVRSARRAAVEDDEDEDEAGSQRERERERHHQPQQEPEPEPEPQPSTEAPSPRADQPDSTAAAPAPHRPGTSTSASDMYAPLESDSEDEERRAAEELDQYDLAKVFRGGAFARKKGTAAKPAAKDDAEATSDRGEDAERGADADKAEDDESQDNAPEAEEADQEFEQPQATRTLDSGRAAQSGPDKNPQRKAKELTAAQLQRKHEEERRRLEQELARIEKRRSNHVLKMTVPSRQGKQRIKDQFSKVKRTLAMRPPAPLSSSESRLAFLKAHVPEHVLNATPCLGKGLEKYRNAVPQDSQGEAPVLGVDRSPLITLTNRLAPLYCVGDRLGLKRLLNKRVALKRCELYAQDEMNRREDEEDFDEAAAEALLEEAAEEAGEEAADDDGDDDGEDDAAEGDEKENEDADGDDGEDGDREADPAAGDGEAMQAQAEENESHPAGAEALVHAHTKAGPGNQTVADTTVKGATEEAGPRESVSAAVLENKKRVWLESAESADNDYQTAADETFPLDEIDDLAMLCSGQFPAAPVEQPPAAAAAVAPAAAASTSSSSLDPRAARAAHSSALILSSLETEASMPSESVALLQSTKEAGRAISGPREKQSLVLPRRTYSAPQTLATQDNSEGAPATQPTQPLPDDSQEDPAMAKLPSITVDGLPSACATFNEVDEEEIAEEQKDSASSTSSECRDRFGLDGIKAERRKQVSKKFFDGEAELSDDEHAVDDDSADEEGEKSDEDLDEDLAESEEAGTSADEDDVRLLKQLKQEEDEEDEAELEELAARFLHRPREDAGGDTQALNSQGRELDARQRAREERRRKRELKRRRREAKRKAKEAEQAALAASLGFTPATAAKLPSSSDQAAESESDDDGGNDRVLQRVRERNEFYSFLQQSKQESSQFLLDDEDSQILSKHLRRTDSRRTTQSLSLSRSESEDKSRPPTSAAKAAAPPTPPRLMRRRTTSVSTMRGSSFLNLPSLDHAVSSSKGTMGKRSFVFTIQGSSSMDMSTADASLHDEHENAAHRRKQTAPVRKLPNGKPVPVVRKNVFGQRSASLQQAMNAKRPKLSKPSA